MSHRNSSCNRLLRPVLTLRPCRHGAKCNIFSDVVSYIDMDRHLKSEPGWEGIEDMYKKAVSLLVLAGAVFMACSLCVKGMDAARLISRPVMTIRLELDTVEEKAEEMNAARTGEPGEREAAGAGEAEKESAGAGETEKESARTGEPGEEETAVPGKAGRKQDEGKKGLGIVDIAVSGQRIVGYSVLEMKYVYRLSEEDLETLLRIVEAEAGSEDEDGKLLVANVVLNRMNSEAFPDTVSEVVFQREKGVSQFSPVANGSFYRVKISEGTVNAVERALMGEDISEGALYFVARKYADSNKVKWFDNHLTYLFKHGGHEFFK